MIDRATAKLAALKFINSELTDPEVPLDIVESEPEQTRCAWVFHYNTKRYLETGIFSERLAGNGPVLVNKMSGNIVALGTGRPLDEQLDEYDKTHSGN
jgi:hypothetical protein